MTKTTGFLLGKFIPPHRGHLFLCRTAQEMVDELTVLVCSTSDDPIPGDNRFGWMQAALPGAKILHLHRDLPQAPEDHPDFWTIWREVIGELHPGTITRVFGSEPYVFRLAQELGAEPIIVDPEREIFPVSGGAIRDNPAAHWMDIAPTARTFFQKRLCVLGPESTGKSRLARIISRQFNTLSMPEYGRTYDIQYKQREHAKGAEWLESDLISLAQTHIAMRNGLAPNAGPLLIEDTDIIQTAIWAKFLLGAPSVALEAMMRDAELADSYLVLSPDVRWIDDGVRYAGSDDTRQWFFDAALERLEKRSAQYQIIKGGDWTTRTARAIDIADRLYGEFRARGS